MNNRIEFAKHVLRLSEELSKAARQMLAQSGAATKNHASPGPLLTRKEVAKRLGVHSNTIQRYQHQGKLRAIVINSRTTRYQAEDVDRFIVGGTVQ